jgi:hypothetical protein
MVRGILKAGKMVESPRVRKEQIQRGSTKEARTKGKVRKGRVSSTNLVFLAYFSGVAGANVGKLLGVGVHP